VKKTLNLYIVTDPLLNDFGPSRPAILIARELSKKEYKVYVVSTCISEVMQSRLESIGVVPVNLGVKLHFSDASLAWIEAWMREAFFSANYKRIGFFEWGEVVLNFSNTIIVPSKAWFLQGLTNRALDNIKNELPWYYNLIYRIAKPIFIYGDKRLLRKASKSSNFLVANSRYCAEIYGKFGVKIDKIIYSPIDCEKFKPKRTKSFENYALTYFGKETKFSTIKKLVEASIKIKAFGSKMSYIPKELRCHKGVELLGRVSDEELVELYSNALFTVFPFTNEEFGYIPVESMACGTPVLTFAFQGPGETIINGKTGWLVKNDREMIETAVKVWRKGYPEQMRHECRFRAIEFDIKKIAEQWLSLIELNN
jgi:glycosyltransferase involved in cell wall biosynthesis